MARSALDGFLKMVRRESVAIGTLVLCMLLLTLFWLPGLRYPVVSDTAIYAFLGRSVWEHGTYMLDALPYAKHLPLHALLSYPFTHFLGINAGMKLSTLIAGYGVLIATYTLIRQTMSRTIALWTVVAVMLHPGFILMTMLGSADLLFTFLFLVFLSAYKAADRNRKFYLLAGVALGLSCLTRYNGAPVFVFFLGYTFFARRTHLQSPWFWSGLLGGACIFGLWFLRNTFVFGNPLHTDYVGELGVESHGPIAELLRNIVYYGNPIHNLFPFFFLFALYGVWKEGRRQPLLLWSAIIVELLALVWWVKAIRFAFPAYPLLLGFAVAGLLHLFWQRRTSLLLIIPLLTAGIAVQGLSICLYTYGACNAFFDRTVGIVPGNMGLTPEGFYAWGLAREYIDTHAPKGSTVEAPGALGVAAYGDGKIFRSDLHFDATGNVCPRYVISQHKEEGAVLFESEAEPRTYVIVKDCASL